MLRAPRRLTLLMPLALALAAEAPAWAVDVTVQVEDSAGKPLTDAIAYAIPDQPAALASGRRTVIIDQVHRQFVPRVNVVQVGTAVRFPNSDNIRHSVYSFSQPKIFQLKLYAGKAANPVVFDKPGLVVLGCNIHDSMVGWVVVVNTPFFARSNSAGQVLLQNLPAGNYSLHVWHEPLLNEPPAQPLHVAERGASQTVRVRVDLNSRSPAAAAGMDMPGMAMPGSPSNGTGH